MGAPAARPIRVLFVCHYNRKRSATAERIFGKEPGLDVRSAGTSQDALVRVNGRMLEWADVIFVMDDHQRAALTDAFPHHGGLDRIVTLDIKDDYEFLSPDLVMLLRERVTPHLDRLRADEARSQSPKPN